MSLLSRDSALYILSVCAVSFVLSSCSKSPRGPQNQPPIVDAGPDQLAAERATIQVFGSAIDPDQDTLQFSWVQISGPDVEIAAPDSQQSAVLLPEVPIGPAATIVLRLTVSDGSLVASDELALTVESNDAIYVVASPSGTDTLIRFDTRTSELAELASASGRILKYNLSPSGDFAAYLGSEESLVRQSLFVVPTGGGVPIDVTSSISNDLASVRDFAWSPDGNRLLYVADPSIRDTWEAFVVDRSGANTQRVSAEPDGVSVIIGADWSPDGRYISQTVTTLGEGQIAIGIYDTQVADSQPIMVNPPPGFDRISMHVWSPDSSRIAFLASQGNDPSEVELFSVLSDGSDVALVSEAPERSQISRFSWSPDGSRLLFANEFDGRELFVSSPAGTNGTRIHTPIANRVLAVERFAWSFDASRIAYTADFEIDAQVDLFTTFPSGTGTVMLSNRTESGRVRDFAWSPDSRWVAYSAFLDSVDDGFRVFVSSSDSLTMTRIDTVGAGAAELVQERSVWSPDSAWLAFVEDAQLRTLGADSLSDPPAPVSRIVSAGSLAFPGLIAWSRDSSRIAYFEAGQNDSVQLRLVSPDGSNDHLVLDVPFGDIDQSSIVWSP